MACEGSEKHYDVVDPWECGRCGKDVRLCHCGRNQSGNTTTHPEEDRRFETPRDFCGGDVKSPPSRHPNSARFHELLKELGDLHDKKQQDYGRGNDPFANVRASTDWGVPAWVGALIRLNDKVERLKNFARKGSLANESAEDSMRDIAVYATIALVLYEQEGK